MHYPQMNELKFSMRTVNLLKKEGISNLPQLLMLGREGLMHLRGCGSRVLDDVESVIGESGLKLPKHSLRFASMEELRSIEIVARYRNQVS